MWWSAGPRPAPTTHENPVPTAYDELCFAEGVYRQGRAQEDAFFARNFRVFREVANLESSVKLITYVPSFFPTRQARHSYAYKTLPQDITIGFVFRGTDKDLVGNLKADFELLWSKLFESNLPQVANKTCSHVFLQLKELQDTYPELLKAGRKFRIHVCGHSLGGFLSEVVTVVLSDYITKEGWSWHCTTFESPGLPAEFVELGLMQKPVEHWRAIMTTYLAAPNPINMLHQHLGSIKHVKVPFEQSVSHVVRCISADASRIWLLGSVACGVATAYQVIATQSGGVLNLPQLLSSLAQVLISGTSSVTTMEALAKVSAAVTASLGVELEEIVAQHAAMAMFTAFDRETGEARPEFVLAMDSWPCLTNLHYTPAAAMQQALVALLPSFVWPSNVGIVNMLDRPGLVQRRIASLPGYCPATGPTLAALPALAPQSHPTSSAAATPGLAAASGSSLPSHAAAGHPPARACVGKGAALQAEASQHAKDPKRPPQNACPPSSPAGRAAASPARATAGSTRGPSARAAASPARAATSTARGASGVPARAAASPGRTAGAAASLATHAGNSTAARASHHTAGATGSTAAVGPCKAIAKGATHVLAAPTAAGHPAAQAARPTTHVAHSAAARALAGPPSASHPAAQAGLPARDVAQSSKASAQPGSASTGPLPSHPTGAPAPASDSQATDGGAEGATVPPPAAPADTAPNPLSTSWWGMSWLAATALGSSKAAPEAATSPPGQQGGPPPASSTHAITPLSALPPGGPGASSTGTAASTSGAPRAAAGSSRPTGPQSTPPAGAGTSTAASTSGAPRAAAGSSRPTGPHSIPPAGAGTSATASTSGAWHAATSAAVRPVMHRLGASSGADIVPHPPPACGPAASMAASQVDPAPVSGGSGTDEGGRLKRRKLGDMVHAPAHMLRGVASGVVTGGLARLGWV